MFESFFINLFDQSTRFQKPDWKATVAVFVDGKEWQLKGWPFASHGQLFNAIRGFHIYMDNLKPAPNCELWNVDKIVYAFYALQAILNSNFSSKIILKLMRLTTFPYPKTG